MSDPQPQSTMPESNGRFKWGIVILILGVLIIASLAFGSSSVPESTATTPTENLLESAGTGTDMVSDVSTETGTPAVPPSPNEVGYTDGIIFFATVLVLILLVATLREVVYRKGV